MLILIFSCVGEQELRFPAKKAPWDPQYSVITVSSVDPSGQGVKQDIRVRPGLTVTSVQGRPTSGMSAREGIKQLEDEILARTDAKEVWNAAVAARNGMPELVEIGFSEACVGVDSQPNVCFNSLMPIDAIVGSREPVTPWGQLKLESEK